MFEGSEKDTDHDSESLLQGKERRATDRVVKIWESTPNKRTILANLDRSLWQHCFLLVMDELPECSVIVDHGWKAGQGLQLIEHNSQTLQKLPRYLGARIFSLGIKCTSTQRPARHSQNQRRSMESPVERYRMALLPLPSRQDPDRPPVFVTRSLLGVFTYQ